MGFSQYKAVEALKGLKAPDLTKSGYITPKRIEEMQIRVGALKLLYGTERVDAPICEALSHLAKEARVHEKMGRLQAMEVMNYVHGCESEERQVGHTAIRDPHPVSKAAKEAREAYQNELEKLRAFLPKIEKYKAMIVVGIGGSYLGTKAVYNALKAFQTNDRKVYFASNVDPDRVQAILEEVDIKTTLVAIISKSGGTLEIKAQEEALRKHFPKEQFLLVTGKGSPMDDPDRFAAAFYMWDYVGGRYSVSSMVGALPLVFAFGMPIWEEFLAGLHDMDIHARVEQDPLKNMPLWGALLGIWNRNILHMQTLAIIPYAQSMDFWSAHLQQLYMESNGKHVAQEDAKVISHETCPVVWGTVGTEGQHAYYQCIHQGTDIIPIEFIGFAHPQRKGDSEIEGTTNQDKLLANLFAQAIALAVGEKNANPNKTFSGNRPSHMILAEKLTPYALGNLLSYHENYVAFQGFIWGINSFDQEGVQLGKVLANGILDHMQGKKPHPLGDAFIKVLRAPFQKKGMK